MSSNTSFVLPHYGKNLKRPADFPDTMQSAQRKRGVPGLTLSVFVTNSSKSDRVSKFGKETWDIDLMIVGFQDPSFTIINDSKDPARFFLKANQNAQGVVTHVTVRCPIMAKKEVQGAEGKEASVKYEQVEYDGRSEVVMELIPGTFFKKVHCEGFLGIRENFCGMATVSMHFSSNLGKSRSTASSKKDTMVVYTAVNLTQVLPHGSLSPKNMMGKRIPAIRAAMASAAARGVTVPDENGTSAAYGYFPFVIGGTDCFETYGVVDAIKAAAEEKVMKTPEKPLPTYLRKLANAVIEEVEASYQHYTKTMVSSQFTDYDHLKSITDTAIAVIHDIPLGQEVMRVFNRPIKTSYIGGANSVKVSHIDLAEVMRLSYIKTEGDRKTLELSDVSIKVFAPDSGTEDALVNGTGVPSDDHLLATFRDCLRVVDVIGLCDFSLSTMFSDPKYNRSIDLRIKEYFVDPTPAMLEWSIEIPFDTLKTLYTNELKPKFKVDIGEIPKTQADRDTALKNEKQELHKLSSVRNCFFINSFSKDAVIDTFKNKEDFRFCFLFPATFLQEEYNFKNLKEAMVHANVKDADPITQLKALCQLLIFMDSEGKRDGDLAFKPLLAAFYWPDAEIVHESFHEALLVGFKAQLETLSPDRHGVKSPGAEAEDRGEGEITDSNEQEEDLGGSDTD